jgi:hypothetical protein
MGNGHDLFFHLINYTVSYTSLLLVSLVSSPTIPGLDAPETNCSRMGSETAVSDVVTGPFDSLMVAKRIELLPLLDLYRGLETRTLDGTWGFSSDLTKQARAEAGHCLRMGLESAFGPAGRTRIL